VLPLASFSALFAINSLNMDAEYKVDAIRKGKAKYPKRQVSNVMLVSEEPLHYLLHFSS